MYVLHKAPLGRPASGAGRREHNRSEISRNAANRGQFSISGERTRNLFHFPARGSVSFPRVITVSPFQRQMAAERARATGAEVGRARHNVRSEQKTWQAPFAEKRGRGDRGSGGVGGGRRVIIW